MDKIKNYKHAVSEQIDKLVEKGFAASNRSEVQMLSFLVELYNELCEYHDYKADKHDYGDHQARETRGR